MNKKIGGREIALGLSMLYAALTAAMAMLNYNRALLIVVIVGGPIVAWAWYVASRKG